VHGSSLQHNTTSHRDVQADWVPSAYNTLRPNSVMESDRPRVYWAFLFEITSRTFSWSLSNMSRTTLYTNWKLCIFVYAYSPTAPICMKPGTLMPRNQKTF
jgi:hypothetical protein